MSRLSWLRVAIVATAVAAVVWFAARGLFSALASVDGATLAAHSPALAGVTLLLAASTLLLAAAWIVLLESASPGTRRSRASLAAVFVYAWAGRYVPGKLPFFAGKVYLGTRLGYGTRPLVVTTAVQHAVEILVAGALGGALMVAALGVRAGGGVFSALALVPALALVALRPVPLRRAIGFGLRIAGREPLPESDFPRPKALVVAAALTVANQLLNGVALMALLSVVADTAWDDAMLVIGALSVSGVLGIVLFVAPAGLGVRDGALTTLLAPRVALESAALAAVLLRVATIVADALLVGAALAWDRTPGHRSASRNTAPAGVSAAPRQSAVAKGRAALAEERSA